MLRNEDLIVGQKYLVEWEDCCTEGSFEGVYLGPEVETVDDGDTYEYGTRWQTLEVVINGASYDGPRG